MPGSSRQRNANTARTALERLPAHWGMSACTAAGSATSEMIFGVESTLEAIGSTPLVRLRHCFPANGAELWLKLENRNPTGSMKDRMALAMIEGAERDGLLSPGDTVVEYTGGSTGPALALVCRARDIAP